MIAAAEFKKTHETSKGRDNGFSKVVVRSLLAVAAVAGLVYLSADSPDLDLRVPPKMKECPIHHVPLVEARAPITYGDLNEWQSAYFHASKVSFPYAGTTVFASTLSRFNDYTEETYRYARVSQCPECVRAEQHWSEADAKVK